MASSNLYQTEQYCHKKFAKHTNKRKQQQMEDKENDFSAQTILDRATKKVEQTEQPLPKRKQNKPLFRPWLDEEDKKKETQSTKVLNPITPNILANQPRSWPVEPKRQNRKNLTNLIHQYNQQAQQYLLQQQQQYYAYYQHQQVAANLRNAFYLQQLQQMALQQRQNQLFVFGQQ